MKVNLSREALELFLGQLHNREEKVNSILVMESKESSKDYTYKFIANKPKTFTGRRYIYLYIEKGGYNNFSYISGTYIGVDTNTIKLPETEGARGGIWLLKQFLKRNLDVIIDNYNIYNTGKCIKCNRILTDAFSINFGMGAKCRGFGNVITKIRNRED